MKNYTQLRTLQRRSEEDYLCSKQQCFFWPNFPFLTKTLGNLCFSKAISTNFIATFSSLKFKNKIKTGLRRTRQETEGRKNVAFSKSWLRFPPPQEGTFRCSLSLAQWRTAFCLGTSVPATCRNFGFSFLFRHFFSLRPLSVNSFFARDCSTRFAACFGDVTIAVAYCKSPCTIHIG
jgi:hypothetical protein